MHLNSDLDGCSCLCQRGDWGEEELCFLSEEPHSLQLLTKLDLRNTEISKKSMRGLTRLTSLCYLGTLRFRPEAFPLLPLLTQLQIVSFNLDYPKPTLADLQQRCHVLTSCKHLSELAVRRLKDESLLTAFLLMLVKSLPQLRQLEFSDCPIMTHLHLLSNASNLESLRLFNCRPLLPASDLILSLQHVSPSLSDLLLWSSARLSVAEQRMFHPPSVSLPSFRKFEYDGRQLPNE